MPAHLEPAEGPPIDLYTGLVVIGRDAACDAVLTESSIAPRHCALVAQEDGHIICDLGSDLGTHVNGERVIGRQPLEPNDHIQLGELAYVYRDKNYVPDELSATMAIEPLPIDQLKGFVDLYETRQIEAADAALSAMADPPAPVKKDSSRPAASQAKKKPPAKKKKRPPAKGKREAIPRSEFKGSRRKRNSDAGTRSALRRELLTSGRRKSSLSDGDKESSQHSHRQNRRLRRRRAAERRQTGRPTRPKRRGRPEADEDYGDVLSQAVAWERRASSASIVDAHCKHCSFKFCHVNDGFADPNLEYSIRCERCDKKITIKPDNRVKVVEKRRWNSRTWDPIIDGLDLVSMFGLVICFVVMLHFVMLAGKGFNKYGRIAGSTFLVFEAAPNHDATTAMVAGVATLVFGVAPFVILAATRVMGEDFTLATLVAVFAGCLLTPIIWKQVPGLTFAKVGVCLYALSAIAIFIGVLKFCDTKETGLTGAAKLACGAFLIVAPLLIASCIATTPINASDNSLIGSSKFAIFISVAALIWVIAELGHLKYLRGLSEFLEVPMLTKAIDECTMFAVLLSAAGMISTVVLSTGVVRGMPADFAWLLCGFVSVINVIWFFQVTRFTRYAIR